MLLCILCVLEERFRSVCVEVEGTSVESALYLGSGMEQVWQGPLPAEPSLQPCPVYTIWIYEKYLAESVCDRLEC